MKSSTANLTEWLGPDARRLWATSFTIDEHEAFALVYRSLGGRAPADGVRLNYHRRGFRRAGQGVVPRAWLHPVDVPNEAPVPTYHPKLLLAETSEQHVLVISTGNIATDDLRHTRNLAVRLRPRAAVANRIADWIRRAPRQHRQLCLLADRDDCQVLPAGANRSTLAQIAGQLERCGRCRPRRARTGEWIVAAPFWSPGTIDRLIELEPAGRIEAYFRLRTIWDQVANALEAPSRARRVAAFELRDGGELPRWHHKVLGWRCCRRPGARAALYLGSANATICGLVGKSGRAVNWEAGVLWLGGASLWDHARSVARAGFAAKALGSPRANGAQVARNDDLGPAESEELQRVFAVHAARCIRVNRVTREVGRSAMAAKPFRALGRRWTLSSLELWVERKSRIRDLGRLSPGVRVRIPADGRAHVRAIFKIADDAISTSGEGLGFAETTIDLSELDPEPVLPSATTRSSIAAALMGLVSDVPGNGNGGAAGRDAGLPNGRGPSDVRFPFSEFLALHDRRPTAALAWLDRIVGSNEPVLEQLPQHWREIARELRRRT